MRGLQISGTARRLFGVLVLMPFILAVWFDTKIASIAVTILAAGMAFELSKMLNMSKIVTTASTLFIALQSLPLWVFDGGIFWHIGLALLSFGITVIYGGVLAGLFAVVLAICLYFSALLLHHPDGHALLLVLGAVVAACDIGAYFVGRSVGGTKLAPKVSPNKTVSGSVGGLIAAIAIMIGLTSVTALSPVAGLDVMTASYLASGVAILSQMGDLLESALKRQFNVKDSSSILPGHGGLLDRFDGYLFTVPGFYLFLFVI